MANKTESLRERRKAETRRQIQEVARALIAENGFEATTMRDVARRAGVGVGTVSLHFKDKISLLFSSFFDEIGEISRQAIESAPEDMSLREQFRHMLRTMYGYYARNDLFLRSVVKEALFATGEWKDRFDRQRKQGEDKVALLVEGHKAAGQVREDVSGLVVARICWSLYISGLVDGLNREHFDVQDQVDRVMSMMDLALGGILTGEGHGAS